MMRLYFKILSTLFEHRYPKIQILW